MDIVNTDNGQYNVLFKHIFFSESSITDEIINRIKKLHNADRILKTKENNNIILLACNEIKDAEEIFQLIK